MTSMNIFVVGLFVQLFLQPVLLLTIPKALDENKIPTVEDEWREWKESNALINKEVLEQKLITDLREEIFQRCMNGKGGYNTYENYVKCKPYVERETQKMLESKAIGSTTPSSDEIIKVESAEAHASEYEEEENDPDFPVEFVDEEKHLNRRVGFWTKLWHRIIDGPELNPYPLF